MARPKKTEKEPSALQRIEDAFWEMMAEMPYESITISALTKRAKVNHNTIYYHYECIDQMALALFEKNIPANIGSLFHTIILSGPSKFRELSKDETILQRWKKTYLFLHSGSPLLMNYLKKRLIESWCLAIEIRPEELTATQKMELEFIFNGMAAAMPYCFDINEPSQMAVFVERPLGRAILHTLADFKNSSAQRDAF